MVPATLSELSLDQRNEVTGERASVDRKREALEGRHDLQTHSHILLMYFLTFSPHLLKSKEKCKRSSKEAM